MLKKPDDIFDYKKNLETNMLYLLGYLSCHDLTKENCDQLVEYVKSLDYVFGLDRHALPKRQVIVPAGESIEDYIK